MTDLEFLSNMDRRGVSGKERRGDRVRASHPTPCGTDCSDCLTRSTSGTALVPSSRVVRERLHTETRRRVIEKAHRVRRRAVWTSTRPPAAVPLEDRAARRLDFAVGGSVKWLCGGPGAGYLYVRPDLANELEPGIVGWAAHATRSSSPTGRSSMRTSPERFQSGTPNVPSLHSARAGLRDRRGRSAFGRFARNPRLTRRLMDLARAAGFRSTLPRRRRSAAGQSSSTCRTARRSREELIRREVIVDYRPGAGIRMAPHFYNTLEEVDHAMAGLTEVAVTAVRRSLDHGILT